MFEKLKLGKSDGQSSSGSDGKKSVNKGKMTSEIKNISKLLGQIVVKMPANDAENSDNEKKSNSEEAKELYAKATKLNWEAFNSAEYRAAKELYEKALQLERNGLNDTEFVFKTLCQLSKCHGYLGEYNQQIELLNQLAELEKTPSADTYYARAIAYKNSDKWDESLADFDRVLELEPDDNERAKELRDEVMKSISDFKNKSNGEKAQDLFERANDSYDSGDPDYDQIIKLYEQAIEYEKTNENYDVEMIGKALDKIFDCYFCLKRYNKQLEVIDRINELKLSNNDSNLLRGLIYYFYLNDYNEALNDFDASLKSNPNDKNAKWMHDLCLKSINGSLQPKDYSELAQQLLEMSEKYFDHYSHKNQKSLEFSKLAVDFEKNGLNDREFLIKTLEQNYNCLSTADEKIDVLSSLIELDPTALNYRVRANIYYFQKSNYEASLSDWERSLELEPDNADAKQMRDQTSYFIDIKRLKKASDEANEPYIQGFGCYNEGKYEQSLELFKKAVVLEKASNNRPDFLMESFKKMALCCFHLENYDKEEEFMNELIKEPSDDGYLARADVYYDLNDFEKALNEVNKALELNADHWGALKMRENCLENIPDPEQKFNSDEAKKLLEKGNIYYEIDEYQKALELFEKAVDHEKNGSNKIEFLVEALTKISVCHFQLDDYEKAIEISTSVLEQLENPASYLLRSGAHLAMENYELAMEDCEKALEYDSNYDPAIELRKVILENMNKS